MKRSLLIGCCLGLFLGAASASEVTHLARFADLHGDAVVFTYEDDLWLTDLSGGDADV